MGILRQFLCLAILHCVVALAIVAYEMFIMMSSHLSYAVAPPDSSETMRAAQFHEFGNASVIKTATIARPSCCGPGQLLVKVGTGALNPVDFKQRRNPAPSMMRPLPSVSGFDFSGEVVKVGPQVSKFKQGDVVYGMLPLLGQPWGALQEYVAVDASVVARAPAKVPAREAAGLPLVGLTVVHALAPVLKAWKDRGESAEGKQILIHAGAGGVGSFAIQYCKHVLGMRVATTTSTRNADFVRGLGADQVVDYRSERFEDAVRLQDVVLDTVVQEYEARTLDSETVLKQGGAGHYCHIISTDWQPSDRETNPIFMLLPLLRKWVYSATSRLQRGVNYHCNPVSPDGEGLARIAEWVDQGLLRPVVDRSFPLEETAEAHRYLEQGRTRGKVLIEVASTIS